MEIPTDIADLLRRLAIRGWKSEDPRYITEVAAGLCAAYGIEYRSHLETSESNSIITRNTAALIEWLSLYRLNQSKESKLLQALLGDLSEEQCQEHYTKLLQAKEDERAWGAIIDRVARMGPNLQMAYARTIRKEEPDTTNPKVKTIYWLEQQLQIAKDITYALAQQAIADNLHAEVLSF